MIILTNALKCVVEFFFPNLNYFVLDFLFTRRAAFVMVELFIRSLSRYFQSNIVNQKSQRLEPSIS